MDERPQAPHVLVLACITAWTGFLVGAALVGLIWWLS